MNKTKKTTKEKDNTSIDGDMSLSEIRELLIELSDSKYWIVLKTLNAGWRATVETGLKTLDPFKEPTDMARAQGQLMALNFLENAVQTEKDRISKGERGDTAKY